MTATREYRAAGDVDDAITAIGVAITVAENLLQWVSVQLPDDYPYARVSEQFEKLRARHDKLALAAGQ